MSLPVGIHENIVFSKAEKNQRGTLVIGFKQKITVDPLAALNSGSGSSSLTERDQDFLIYPPRLENYEKQIDTPDNMFKKLSSILDPLSHILHQYMTKDKVKWDITKGMGIEPGKLSEVIVTQKGVDKVYDNIVDQFIAMVTPFIHTEKNPGELMRVVFIRRNAAKHFPELRKAYLETSPFIERMNVPVSKIAFTKWENANGYANPAPVDGSQSVSSSEAKEAEDLLKD